MIKHWTDELLAPSYFPNESWRRTFKRITSHYYFQVIVIALKTE